jgi:CHAT domain-containing protein
LSNRLKVALALTALAALIAVGWSQSSIGRGVLVRYQARQELQTLAREIGGPLHVAGRLTLAGGPGGGSSERSANRSELSPQARISVARLERWAALSRDPEVLAAAGIAALVDQRAEKGLRFLEQARVIAPHNAVVLTNLAAAFLSRGQPGDAIRAFDIAWQAARAAPRSPTALFNVSVAAERVLPSDSATERWEQYLAHETDPTWRTEAATRLFALRNPSGEIDELGRVLSGRRELTQTVLPRWARACLDGSTSRRDEVARPASMLASQIGGPDRHARDLAAWLIGDGSEQRCDTGRARLYLDLVAARQMYLEDRQAEARVLLERIIEASNGDQVAVFTEARILLAPILYLSGNHQRALSLCAVASTVARDHHYFSLLGRSEYIRGWAAQDGSRFQDAFDAYRDALTAYAAGRDEEGVAVTQTITASLLDAVGEYRAAWEHREVALSKLRTVQPSKATYSILSEATKAALRDGLLGAAFELSNLSVERARADRSTLRAAEAAIDRASIAFKVTEHGEAVSALHVARRELEAVGEAAGFDRLRAKLLLVEAAERTSRPADNIANLSAALDAYRDAGSDILAAKLYLARGRAYWGKGDSRAADGDFEAGLRRFERVRATLRDALVRVSYFDEAWQLFDEAIALRVAERRFDDALDLAERQRGRELRDALAKSRVTAGQPEAALPPDARLIYYVVLPNRTVIWVIGGGSRHVEHVEISRGDLESLVTTFRQGVDATESDDSARSSERLYQLLIACVEQHLGSAVRLYIAADPILQRLPFAALRRPGSGPYLIERFEIAMVPALSIVERRPPSAGRRLDALVISAALRGRTFGIELEPLPLATVEAADVARLYPKSKLIADADVASESIRAELPRHTVFHFAGHSLVNPDAPQMSRLVVSPNRPDGALYAHEIERLDLRRVEMVVLSACDTADGRSSRSEGVISVARAFMKAGVPTVIATLWSVEDSAARSMFARFHSGFLDTSDPARVLAIIQREIIRGGTDRRGLGRWAAPVVVTRYLE